MTSKPALPGGATARGAPITLAIVNDYEVVVRGVAAMLAPYRDRIAIVELDVGCEPTTPVDVARFDTFASPRQSLTRALTARTGSVGAGCAGLHQSTDRSRAVSLGGHREDSCQTPLRQAWSEQPIPGHTVRRWTRHAPAAIVGSSSCDCLVANPKMALQSADLDDPPYR